MKNNLLIPLVLLLVAIVCIIVGIVYLTRPKSTDDVNNKNNIIGKHACGRVVQFYVYLF
jgi:hypothetical protein